MKVRMLTHYSRGGPDHISVNHYNGGQKYDLPDSEAMLFIDMGIAVEDKDMERAPEVKADADGWISEPANHLMYRDETKTSRKRRK